jgi:NAD(P)-dependent dehydrogenase (short-subunit alcohol dehydrogenase family)
VTVAFVVGGARGICRATARVLADAGHTVGVIDRDPAPEVPSRLADVSDVDGFTGALDSLTAELGAPDVLLYGAGITNHIAPVAKMTMEGWRRELDVNLTGAFVAIQHVLPAMVEKGYGRIVVISSVAAKGGLFRQAGYAASKAGLIGLAQTVALEHARHGVTCNIVLPGLIATEVVAAMPPEITESAVAVTPARRTGTMDEVAHVIRFLASEEAAYVNGAEVLVDGGQRLNGGVVLGSRREVSSGSGRAAT